jgi:hypothetical protein
MIFAVDSEKKRGILIVMQRLRIGNSLNFVDDVEVVISQRIKCEDAFKASH